ncbi:MAG: alpha/beta fold hydrolase [Candidatus Puniceispirillaceae bacterium]
MKKFCCPHLESSGLMPCAYPLIPDRQLYATGKVKQVISFRQQEPADITATTPTLVFLHGFNGNSASWQFQFSHFQRCRVISIDAPGFGGTSVFENGMAGFARAVTEMIYDLGLAPFWLIGHSMGGMLAQIIAARTGKDCRGLVLSCTHKGRARPEGDPLSADVLNRIEQRSRLNDHDYGTLRIGKMLSGTPSPDIQEFLVSIAGDIRVEGIKWGGAAIQHIDTTDYLPRITAPILILSGNQDIVVKPASLAALIDDLPEAQHVEMQGVGHAPYCEDADRFNGLVQQFIQQNSSP